jgi:hypothetical protein
LVKYKENFGKIKINNMSLFKLKKTNKPEIQAKEQSPEEKGNVYTNIFEEKAEKPKETEESQVITGVYAKKEEEVTEKENILGPLPELDTKIVGAFDPSKRNLKIVRGLFFTIFFLSLLTIGFFYAELNPNFDLLTNVRGANTAQKLMNSEAEVVSMQTSINQKNYLLLNYYLQKASYLADTYAKARKDQLSQENLMIIQDDFLLTYENALTKWKEPMAVGNIPQGTFEGELKNELQEELRQLRKETPNPAILAQIADYESTNRMVGNKRLNTFFSKDTDEIRSDLPQDDKKLYSLTREILDIMQNDFSTISLLKQNRIEWALIVNELEKITKSVDTLYNTGFFDELGGIEYSSYDFDAKSNQIVISGKAKRDDGTTFSLITNLMDALEKSSIFTNIDNRTFPKTGSEDSGYISPFRIELTLN